MGDELNEPPSCLVVLPLERGDLVRVLDHQLPGFRWTVGKIGSVYCSSHIAPFDRLHNPAQKTPRIREGWWVVAVCSDTAKGGYALAALPEECLAPHACTERCPAHECQMA